MILHWEVPLYWIQLFNQQLFQLFESCCLHLSFGPTHMSLPFICLAFGVSPHPSEVVPLSTIRLIRMLSLGVSWYGSAQAMSMAAA